MLLVFQQFLYYSRRGRSTDYTILFSLCFHAAFKTSPLLIWQQVTESSVLILALRVWEQRQALDHCSKAWSVANTTTTTTTHLPCLTTQRSQTLNAHPAARITTLLRGGRQAPSESVCASTHHPLTLTSLATAFSSQHPEPSTASVKSHPSR